MQPYLGAWIVVLSLGTGSVRAIPPGGVSPPAVLRAGNVSERALEEGVIAKLHETNGMEIAMGELAVKRASNPRVRDFSDLLIRDHELADRLLRALARDRGLSIPGPTSAAKPQELATMSRLRNLGGPAFDQAFLETMIVGHEEALGTLSGAWNTVAQPGLRKLVRRLIPIFEQHLELARSLAAARGPTS